MLLAISAFNKITPTTTRPIQADWCRSAALAFSSGQVIDPPEFKQAEQCDEITLTLTQLAIPYQEAETELPKGSFFVENAFTDPVHQQFALKTTMASVICYLVYTAMDWQDIHTAMITCYVAALGSTGETVHKLALRIVGCLIGALLGMLSLIFIVPFMSDIGQLMVLVFTALMLSAWVSSGSERIAYAGIQMGLLLVSFLVVLAIPFIMYASHNKAAGTKIIVLIPIKSNTAPDGHFFIQPKVRSPHHIIVGINKIH